MKDVFANLLIKTEDMKMTETERLIAKDLLGIKAVFFRPDEPFTWASGIKSPVYCDSIHRPMMDRVEIGRASCRERV